MPAAYYDTGCDIIPLRIAYSTHFALTVFSYIDDWIWFKTPIVATKEIICDFGYHWGGCPVAEKNRKIDYESTGYYRFKTTKYLFAEYKKNI